MAPIIPVQKNEVIVLSWRAAYLVRRLYKANISAEIKGIIACKENTLLVGFNMIMTPTKPIKIADHRFQPTYYFKTGPDNAATSSG